MGTHRTRMLHRHILVAALVLSGGVGVLTGNARAAEITVSREGDGPPQVTIAGEIETGDAVSFDAAVKDLPPALVTLSGPGGKLIDALSIGEAIRARGDTTTVGSDSHCTSACALIWIAGAERSWQDGGAIGFHAASAREGGVVRATASGNAIVGAYLTRLGYPLTVVVMATEAEHTSMTYLTPERAERDGLSYQRVERAAGTGSGRTDDRTLADAGSESALATRDMGAVSPPATAVLEDARRFVAVYFASVNADPAALRTLAGQIYAERVTYFGDAIGRGELIRRRAAERQKWQHFAMAPSGPADISCSFAGDVCIVSGTASYAGRGAGQSAANGTLFYRLALSRVNGWFRVTAEDDAADNGSQWRAGRRMALALQRELARAGCAPGPADGVWGRRSQDALNLFVRRNGLAMMSPGDAALVVLGTAKPGACRERRGRSLAAETGSP